jgi:hypothetical protein
MKKHIAALAVAVNALVLHHGASAVIVTVSSSAPTENIELSNVGTQLTTTSVRWTTPTNKRDLGQTFTVEEAFDLSSLVIYTPGASPTTVERAFTLTIESFANSSVTSTRTTVSAQSGVLQNMGSGNQYVTFTLDTPVHIAANTVYGFRLGFDTEDASSLLVLSYQGTYAGGVGYQIDYSVSSTPSAVANDVGFYLVAVPEPSAAALLTFGAVGIAGLRRRHKFRAEGR